MSRKEEKDHELEPVSPGARLMQAPGLNLCIIAVMGFTTKIDPNVFKKGLQHTLIKHPRFSSLLIVKNSKFTWRRTRVEMEEHVFVPDLDPDMEYSGDEFVEDYMSALSTTPMDMKKPLWEIHILNVKTSDADSVLVFKIHHSIGDGVSLTALVLACARKTSDPESLPVISSAKKRKPHAAVDKGFRLMLTAERMFVLVWTMVLVVFNTCVDCLLFLATVLFLKDKWTPIKVARGVDALSSRKRFVHRIISLDDVKLVKTAMNVSINDVVLGITEAGISRYLNMRYGKIRENVTDQENMKKNSKNHLPKNLCIRSAVVFNLRPSATIEDMAEVMENAKELKGMWGNLIGICLLPLTISLHEEDPLIHVSRAKSTMDAKKLSLGHKCAFAVMKLMMFLFGNKIAGGVSRKVFQNTTLTFSNVVGPEEEISIFGHPLSYIAPSVNGFPQALIIHYQSYGDKLIIAMGADEKLIPNPHQLCDDLAISHQNMKQAVIKKGLVQFC